MQDNNYRSVAWLSRKQQPWDVECPRCGLEVTMLADVTVSLVDDSRRDAPRLDVTGHAPSIDHECAGF